MTLNRPSKAPKGPWIPLSRLSPRFLRNHQYSGIICPFIPESRPKTVLIAGYGIAHLEVYASGGMISTPRGTTLDQGLPLKASRSHRIAVLAASHRDRDRGSSGRCVGGELGRCPVGSCGDDQHGQARTPEPRQVGHAHPGISVGMRSVTSDDLVARPLCLAECALIVGTGKPAGRGIGPKGRTERPGRGHHTARVPQQEAGHTTRCSTPQLLVKRSNNARIDQEFDGASRDTGRHFLLPAPSSTRLNTDESMSIIARSSSRIAMETRSPCRANRRRSRLRWSTWPS